MFAWPECDNHVTLVSANREEGALTSMAAFSFRIQLFKNELGGPLQRVSSSHVFVTQALAIAMGGPISGSLCRHVVSRRSFL